LSAINRINVLLFLSIITLSFSGCVVNQKLVGKAFYFENNMICTKVNCQCCNDCKSPLFFITDKDTIQLYGARTYSGIRSVCKIINNDTSFTAETLSTTKKKQPLVCAGKECGALKCTPFELGKVYEIQGSYLPQSEGSLQKAFNVLHYTLAK